jgi:uncharacterized protein YbbK (DUF523 family)
VSDLTTRYRLLHGGDKEAARAELERLRTSGKQVVAVSACLLGVRCRYDGQDRQNDAAVERFVAGADVEILPVCPEVLAELGVPRPPMTLSADGKRVIDEKGRDVTQTVDAGARLAELYVEKAGATRALLKERSPSCGVNQVHTEQGVVSGQGRFAARLKRRGLPIVSEE